MTKTVSFKNSTSYSQIISLQFSNYLYFFFLEIITNNCLIKRIVTQLYKNNNVKCVGQLSNLLPFTLSYVQQSL